MNEKRNNFGRMSFILPMMLFLLLFVVCCGVLAGVFLQASARSSQAGAYNDSIQLCRNHAEIARASGVEPGVYYYDRNLQPTAEDGAVYRVTVEAENKETGAGVLQSGTISAGISREEPLYSLNVVVYLPEQEASHGE